MSNSTFIDTLSVVPMATRWLQPTGCKLAVSRKGGPALGWFSGTPGPIVSESSDVQVRI